MKFPSRLFLLFVTLYLCGGGGGLLWGAEFTSGPRIGPGGHYYEVVYVSDQVFKWEQARIASLRRDTGLGVSHLATIGSEREDVFIEKLRQEVLVQAGIDPHGADPPPFWVGGYQPGNPSAVGEGWFWLDDEGESWGEPLDAGYTQWSRGEPNDWPTAAEDQQEDYLVIGHAGRFGWNDAGAQMNGYVVEYEVDSDPVVVGPRYGPNGSRYSVVIDTHRRTWDEAAEEAYWSKTGLRGTLATITSQEEADFIDELVKQAVELAGFNPGEPDMHPELWIGGRQERDEAGVAEGWSWGRGEGVVGGTDGGSGFSNWQTGEPNDWPSTTTEDNDENHMVIGFRGQPGWNDTSGKHLGYVIEYAVDDYTVYPRSTRYDGSVGRRVYYQPELNRNVAMTLEAWVYRENWGRRETVVMQGAVGESYWFGFEGARLGFARGGGGLAISSASVPSGQWTHVAASYDGVSARFYINGEAAGVSALGNAGATSTAPVYIGIENGDEREGLDGSIDELRLWSRVRSESEIRGGRFAELRDGAGLEAVWPYGGFHETILRARSSTFPIGGTPIPQVQPLGILPVDLFVPLGVVTPTLDGNVDVTTEYAGAETLVLRYDDGPNFKDAVAHLVHSDEFLYVGIEGVRLPAGGSPSEDNLLDIFIDAFAETTGIDEDAVRGQFFLEDSRVGFSDIKTIIIFHPVTGANYFYEWQDGDPTSLEFLGGQGTERVGEFTTIADVEFRFHRSLLGDFGLWSSDRIAVRHASNGGPSGDRWGPSEAEALSSSGWAKVRYLSYPGTELPRVSQWGWVVDPDTGMGVEGIEVSLIGRVVYATTTTAADGRFSFGTIEVGVGEPRLIVRIDPPEGALLRDVEVLDPSARNQPTALGLSEAIFPGCSYSCVHTPLRFNVSAPPPPVEISGFSPATIWPPVLLREAGGGDPAKVTPTPTVRLDLSSAHEQLDFYLLMGHCPNDPRASSLCEEGVDYFRLDAVRVVPDDGAAAYYELTIPYDHSAAGVAGVPYPRGYRIAAHDRYAREGNDPTRPSSWRYAPGMIGVTEPPYEMLHGFAFENVADGHDVDDYRAAFYDQACNPLTMVGFWAFAPIYLDVLGGGECVGLVVTANRFARGFPYTSPGSSLYPVHSRVRFGGGFPHTGERSPVLPALFDTSNPCSPAPQNIWAQIRANHGVQMSSELIGKLLEQFHLDGLLLSIDLEGQLAKLRGDPLRYQVCIKDGDKGHCVQPLRVIDEVFDDEGALIPDRRDVVVWDPNLPNQTRVIEITLNAGGGSRDRYVYRGFTDAWSGNWMFVYDVEEIWGGERHVPSLDTLGAALPELGAAGLGGLLQVIVSGDAEPLVVSDAGEVGWDASGNFVETGAGTIAVPSFNWNPNYEPALGHLPMMMFHRMGVGTPEVRVHNRGEAYKLHTSHEGSMLQLFVEGGVAGEVDTVEFSTVGDLVDGVSLSSGAGGRTVESRVALCRDGSSYPAAIEFGGVQVPAGKSVGLRMLGSGGVEFLNDTGAIVAPDFSILRPGLQGASLRRSEVPNLRIPVGAALRIESPDGTTFENLLFGIDVTRDGTVDESYLFRSARVGLEQVIDGVPVGFEIEHGAQELKVRWLYMPGWRLVVSRDFEQWDVAGGVVVADGMAEWRGQGAPGGVFFRLEEMPE